MKRLIFNAPAHHQLLEGDSEIHGGDEFAVSNVRAEQLLADRTVSVYEAPDSDLVSLNRDDLNAVAEQAGVPSPGDLPNKQAVLDEINRLEAVSLPPEADTGEGHDTNLEED